MVPFEVASFHICWIAPFVPIRKVTPEKAVGVGYQVSWVVPSTALFIIGAVRVLLVKV
jgi:hypothetical protein